MPEKNPAKQFATVCFYELVYAIAAGDAPDLGCRGYFVYDF